MSDTDEHQRHDDADPPTDDSSQDASQHGGDVQNPNASSPDQSDAAPDPTPADPDMSDPSSDNTPTQNPAPDDSQSPIVNADAHQTLHDRFHAMEDRIHALEQTVGEHIGKLYEHIRRIGL